MGNWNEAYEKAKAVEKAVAELNFALAEYAKGNTPMAIMTRRYLDEMPNQALTESYLGLCHLMAGEPMTDSEKAAIKAIRG